MSADVAVREHPPVEVSAAERSVIAEAHHRVDREPRDVWDREALGIITVFVDVETPYCAECGEEWGTDGCATYRVILLLAQREREAAAAKRRAAELQEALTPRFGVHRLREPKNETIELRMQIDAYSLTQGGIGLVDAVLAKMHNHWRKWFKDFGDHQRIRADHAYALTIDNERYAYLTQEFDPWKAAIKIPGAPWDEDWQGPA